MPRRELPKDAVLKAAYLASIGVPQTGIASKLEVSPPTASRLILQAKLDGILRTKDPELILDPERCQTIAHELFGRNVLFDKLSKLSEGALKDLAVFDVKADMPSAPTATYILENILHNAGLVGVTWGANIAALVSAIEAAAPKRKNLRPQSNRIVFAQVCGDSQENIATSARSSVLVSTLNRIFGNTENQYTFSMSASIPKRLAKQSSVIREFIQAVGDYGKIFSIATRTPRLALRLDILLTSCGNATSKQDRWLSECARDADISDGVFRTLTIGNIAGYWLPRDGLPPSKLKLLEEINDRWIGITLDDISEIARRGGVVLIATEDYKAEIIVHLVRSRLISRLIISEDLEQSISKLLEVSDDL